MGGGDELLETVVRSHAVAAKITTSTQRQLVKRKRFIRCFFAGLEILRLVCNEWRYSRRRFQQHFHHATRLRTRERLHALRERHDLADQRFDINQFAFEQMQRRREWAAARADQRDLVDDQWRQHDVL